MIPNLHYLEDGEKKDLDAVLVGADNPEYKKTQQYKTVMDQIAKGDYSNPIIKEIMKEPIPEDLQGLPAAAVFKVTSKSNFVIPNFVVLTC